jgi:hypothetical protein
MLKRLTPCSGAPKNLHFFSEQKRKKSIKTKTSPLTDKEPKLQGLVFNKLKIYMTAPLTTSMVQLVALPT